jgi:hypothetical protein
MKEFNDKNTKDLKQDEWYIVKCPMFCESRHEIAKWEFNNFVSQANGDFINQYVSHFKLLKEEQ